MLTIRMSKTLLVASIALFATLAAFGNITDYGSNFEFVRHVLLMDTIFPDATIKYRAIASPALHHTAYILIIAAETLAACLCWVGTIAMFRKMRGSAAHFNQSKKWAVVGLTLAYLVWQVVFLSIGGEWFGMWMSETWNGIDSAFRFFITILTVLIYVVFADNELQSS